jgi:hypothetical protein
LVAWKSKQSNQVVASREREKQEGRRETPKEKLKRVPERGGPENIVGRRAVRAVEDLVFISNRA